MNNEKQIELNDKTIENQDWMIKFLLLELKDTIITKNKKIAAWRSTALKCAPPTSGLHKFADEKDVPDVDEEFLAIINDILKKQKTVPGATQFPEYADSSKESADENEGSGISAKAAFNAFVTKQGAVSGAEAEAKVEEKDDKLEG
ncbi:hypothetical protein L3Y34_011208 [Caenorhabditis briggsae]|uniref:Uncharacterized protein n=1 Tax=Caenorhabditis briggsae TaxID=6238 RepID=A0AAE9CUQ8_CAEBR|nr:hypothetical protein L3Y34_011208 [Caenorhabditis briggsae]